MKSEANWFVSLLDSLSRCAKFPLGRRVRTSPFVILAFITAFLLLYQLLFATGGPDEWRHPLLLRLLFLLVLFVLFDVVLKRFIEKNYWLWITELFMCLGFVYYWIVT